MTRFIVERWSGYAHGGWERVDEVGHLSEAEGTVAKLVGLGLKAKNIRILVGCVESEGGAR